VRRPYLTVERCLARARAYENAAQHLFVIEDEEPNEMEETERHFLGLQLSDQANQWRAMAAGRARVAEFKRRRDAEPVPKPLDSEARKKGPGEPTK
jgi:hypothetical protein